MKIEISTDKSSATIDGVEYELKKVRQPIIQCLTCGKEQYPCEHNEGKKISEWLNDLPDGYRELALANFKEQGCEDIIAKYKYDAIHNLGDWGKTKEGDKLWLDIYNHYYRGSQLPPLPKPKFEVWKPKVGEDVWFNNINGEPIECRYSKENVLYRFFQTKEQAIEAHEKAMFNYEVEMFIKEKNEGVMFDYNDNNQAKHYLIYDYIQEKIYNSASYRCKSVSDEKVFKTPEIGEEIIAKFDNEKLVKYWI